MQPTPPPPPPGSTELAGATPWPAAIARLALWALAVSLVISRAGLVLHELVGHGLAATGAGGRVTAVRLYGFGGGWIEYTDTAGWSRWQGLAVAMAGIAVELVTAAVLAGIGWRRGRGDLRGTALVAAALGLAIHGGFYLAAGTADGFGDGAALHRALGDGRWALVVPVAVLLAVGALVGGRRVGGELRASLPVGSRGRQAAAVAIALVVAGGIHAALVVGELRLRPSPTYARVMTTARERAIEQALARLQAEAAQAGRVATVAERAEVRRTVAARQPRRIGPALALAIALAAALGLVVVPARARRRPVLTTGAAVAVAIVAIAAVIIVVAIDRAAAAWW